VDLRDYLAALRRQWVLIAVTCLATVAAAAAFTLQQPPVYQARAQLFVSSGGGDDTIAQAYQGGLFIQQRMRSYVQLATSPDVLEPAAEAIGWPAPAETLAGRIRAESPADTVLINITAQSANPEEAAAIANAVADNFAAYVERVEARDAQGQVPVKVSITNPASPPGSAISPQPVANVMLGLALGLVLGLAVASVRELLDTAMHSEEDIEAVSGAPVLGRVAFDRSATRDPLADLTGSPRAEAFRVVRTNLQYVDVENPIRTVVVTSSVPAEGKTTTAANLASSLSQTGLRVILVECDLRRPRSIEILGLVAGAGLTDVLVGRAAVDDVVQRADQAGIDVLGSGPVPPNPSELLASQAMSRLLQELERDYEMVILDAPPLIPVTDAAVLARSGDGALVVVRHGKTTKEQLKAARGALKAVDARILGVIINMVPARAQTYEYDYRYTPAVTTKHKRSTSEDPGRTKGASPNSPGQPDSAATGRLPHQPTGKAST
jgi:capsular exopolysaccharide synthesis family protein